MWLPVAIDGSEDDQIHIEGLEDYSVEDEEATDGEEDPFMYEYLYD